MAVAVSALLLSCSLSLSSCDNLVNNYLLQVDKGKDKGKNNYLLEVDKDKHKVDEGNQSETGADYSDDFGSEEEEARGGGGSKCHTQKGEVCTFPFKYTDGKH